MWQTILAGRKWQGELTNRRKDSSLYRGRMTISAIHGKDGEITHFVAGQQKLTERPRIEAQIHPLAQAVDDAYEFFGVVDREGLITYANRAFLQFLGGSIDETIGRDFGAVLAGNPPRLRQEIGEKMFENEGWKGECLLLRADGTVCPIMLRTGPVKDEGGRVTGSFCVGLDISDRKRTAAALERSEQQFRELAENIREVFFTHTIDPFRMTYISPAHEEIWGRPRQEVYDRPAAWIDSIHPDDRDRAIRRLEQAQGGEAGEVEFRIVRPDGSVRWIRTRTFPVHDSHGKLCRVAGFAEDITERRKTDDALGRSEAKFKALFEAAKDAILIVKEKRFVDCNPSAEILFACQKADIVGRSPLDFSPPEQPDGRLSSDKAAEKMAAAMNGQPQSFGWRHMRLDGTAFDAELSLNRVITPEGEHLQAIIRDVTERKRVEEDLKLFRLLVDESNDAIQVIDHDTMRFIDVNERACTSLGYTRDELLTMRVPDIDPTVDEATHASVDDELRKSGRAIFQGLQRRKDGSTFPVEVSLRPVQLDRRYMVCAIRDVTERKQVESDLQKAHTRLRIALEESEQQAREAIKLTELVDILQSCQTVAEAYKILERILPEILSSDSGAVCITNPSHNIVEAVAAWGDTLAMESTFAPDKCWALRRGKAHQVIDSASPLRCAHFSGSRAGGQICVPLAAHGETLGVLCLQQLAQSPGTSVVSPQGAMDALTRQARAVGERISMALANLRLREVLRSQSIRDPLTGLFNRRFMEESFERELRRAARCGENATLLMVDIDHFKQFNDTFGHQAGDALLRGLGDFLSQRIRGQDVACRYGGEEFALILAGASGDVASKRAERLREELKELTVRHAGQTLGRVTLSIGIAVFPDHGSTVDELLRLADQALYRAKTEGRDRVIVANPK